MTRRRQILLDCCLLYLLAAIFLAPYFTHKYTNQWPSIESTFIADARFLATHWPHPQWQPLWYTGTRFDYIYPPALRYGTALLSNVFGWWTVKAYHFYTMFFYCLGIAGVYLLVRLAGRSRAAAYLSAIATGLMSPSLLFMKNMRIDSGPWVPVRFGALIRYGEGPHITALCLLPIALAFAWRAFEARRPAALALAAIFSAAVVSNNFYGATSLAIFFPLLVWSFWVTRRDRRLALPALGIPLLAYGLTAFWLSPSYLRITLHNMQYVSEKGSVWSVVVALVVVVAFGFASYRLSHHRGRQAGAPAPPPMVSTEPSPAPHSPTGVAPTAPAGSAPSSPPRPTTQPAPAVAPTAPATAAPSGPARPTPQPAPGVAPTVPASAAPSSPARPTPQPAPTQAGSAWPVFVAGAMVVFGLNVLGHYYLNFRVIGEPGRLIPELDLVIILAVVLFLEWLWRLRGPWPKLAAAVVVVAAFATTARYVRQSRHIIEPWPDYRSRVEFRVTDWLWKNMPDARVCTSGTVRFWFDTWHDLAEYGGGSDQGILNPVVPDSQWEVSIGTNPEFALLWLQAMGTGVMYVAQPNSEEPYKDTQHIDRFSALPVLWDDGQGNTLYSTRRRFAPRARVVETARLDALKTPRTNEDIAYLRPYVDAVENGPDSPATLERQGTDAMVVRARLVAGQSILVQETWDPAWRAAVDGRPLAVRKDPMGFMLVDPPPGDRAIRFEFAMPLENRVGWGVTAVSLLALAGLFLRGARVRVRVR